jgi:hypothetical protein
LDRSWVPHRQPLRPDERRVETIAALRRLFPLPKVAESLGMTPSTVSEILTRIGLGRSSCSSRSRTRENAVVTRQVVDTGSGLLVDSRCHETLQV